MFLKNRIGSIFLIEIEGQAGSCVSGKFVFNFSLFILLPEELSKDSLPISQGNGLSISPENLFPWVISPKFQCLAVVELWNQKGIWRSSWQEALDSSWAHRRVCWMVQSFALEKCPYIQYLAYRPAHQRPCTPNQTDLIWSSNPTTILFR